MTAYALSRDGKAPATTTAVSYTFSGLSCGHSYKLTVVARDAVGNKSAAASLTVSTSACTWTQTTGGATNTWTNYTNAGGTRDRP